MNVSTEDATLFFDLMFPLQLYVNKNKNIYPEIETIEAYIDLGMKAQAVVRDALWESPDLIQQYVSENPNQMPPTHLEIVDGWQTFVKGRFVMERLLKKHAIFIQNDDVYGVLALHNSFDELIPKQMLPVYVETVLLPFKEAIIYDGLIRGGNIMIGSNMGRVFKHKYLDAKRSGEIIISLDSEHLKGQQVITPLTDWQPTIKMLSNEAKKLRAQGGSPPTWSPAFSLVKASLAFAETAVSSPDDENALWKSFERIVRALDRAGDVIDR